MKTVLKTALGLVFDDWWLGIGLLASILLSYLCISAGADAQLSGWILLLLMVGTLMISLRMEFLKLARKKASKK